MTDTTITVHGFDFSVTGDGFRVNRDDFDRVADKIADRFFRMKPATVARLHAGAMMDEKTGGVSSPAAVIHLDAIAYKAAEAVTRRWMVKDNILVSVYPV